MCIHGLLIIQFAYYYNFFWEDISLNCKLATNIIYRQPLNEAQVGAGESRQDSWQLKQQLDTELQLAPCIASL